AAAHGVDHGVLGARKVDLGKHRENQEYFANFGIDLTERGERKTRELIHAEAEDAAVFFEHPDHFVKLSVHTDLFAYGIGVWEERIGDRVADDHDRARVGLIELRDEAAGGDAEERD